MNNDILRIEDRPYIKEYKSNPWDTAHGTTMGPIAVNQRIETTPRDIIFGNNSYTGWVTGVNATRGIVINTIQFDAELVPMFTGDDQLGYTLQGVFMKREDLINFFMPAQDSGPTSQFGLLTCDLFTFRTNMHDYTAHAYTEIHYDPFQNPWLGAYTMNDLYKHYFHTFPLKFAWASNLDADTDMTAFIGAVVFGYQYSWFASPITTSDMIMIQTYGSLVFNAAQYAQILAHPNTCNVGVGLYDGNSVNAIYSNADIIRGNKWSQADTGQN